MKTLFKTSLALAVLTLAAQASAQVTFYPLEGFRGPATVFTRDFGDILRQGYTADTSSVIVEGGIWEVCDDSGFRGQCMLLKPGRYPTLASTGLEVSIASARRYDDVRPVAARAGVATLYDEVDFGGRELTARDPLSALDNLGFNDRASSLVIEGGNWELCEHNNFRGKCVVIGPGRYASLQQLGLSDRLSSLRPVTGAATPPAQTAVAPAAAPAEIVLYDNERFGGASFSTREPVQNLTREGYNDRASSIVVRSGSWEVCSDSRFRGRCVILQPGQYSTLSSMALNDRISSVRRVDSTLPAAPPPIASTAVFYELEGFRGSSFTAHESIWNLDRMGMQNRAGSVEVRSGRWDVCEDPRFGGHCMQLQPGRYPSVGSMGLADRVASTRAMGEDGRMIVGREDRNPAGQMPDYDARRRPGETLYEAQVTAVREVVGNENQRCYVDRNPQPQAAENRQPNIGGLLAGAVIGGILGHQVGGGRGKDLATIGAAVAGAAIGANIGRDRGQVQAQDINRCTDSQVRGGPHFWDVTYTFRGIEHHVQMNQPPQSTITVNADGEPRA